MNPSIFVSVSTEPGVTTAPRENIRYDQFVARLLKPLPENLNALHIAIGLAGELCELSEEIVDQVEEYGDYEFYLQALLNHYNLTLADCSDCKQIVLNVRLFTHHTGQLIDAIKREYIYQKPRELERIKESITIVHGFLIGEYNELGVPRAEILQANALKLEKRYAGLYYSDAAAQARADKN
jgi:hypothetical protein